MRKVRLPSPLLSSFEAHAVPRLIKFTVEGVRTKLDRIYLESLEASARSHANNRVMPDETSALQEELESLYAEILPVAQMSAEKQFLEPALKDLEAKKSHSLARSTQATSYVGGINTHPITIPS